MLYSSGWRFTRGRDVFEGEGKQGGMWGDGKGERKEKGIWEGVSGQPSSSLKIRTKFEELQERNVYMYQVL